MAAIESTAQRCLTLFEQLADAITDERMESLGVNLAMEVEDQQGRFNLWCDDQHVFAGDQSAIDHHLRQNGRLREFIIEALEQIGDSTSQAREAVRAVVPETRADTLSNNLLGTSKLSDSEAKEALSHHFAITQHLIDSLYGQTRWIQLAASRSRARPQISNVKTLYRVRTDADQATLGATQHEPLPNETLPVEERLAISATDDFASRRTPGHTLEMPIISHKTLLGTVGETEYADFRYKKRGRDFFRWGRVFWILGSEDEPEDDDKSTTAVTAAVLRQDSAGRDIMWNIRRFIVVQEGENSCYCLRLATYGGKGVAAEGVRKDEHSVIHKGRKPPRIAKEEQADRSDDGGMRTAVRVTQNDNEEKLDPMMRLHWYKTYKIGHNIKARDFGEIHDSSRPILSGEFRAAQESQAATAAKNVTDRSSERMSHVPPVKARFGSLNAGEDTITVSALQSPRSTASKPANLGSTSLMQPSASKTVWQAVGRNKPRFSPGDAVSMTLAHSASGRISSKVFTVHTVRFGTANIWEYQLLDAGQVYRAGQWFVEPALQWNT